MKSCLTLTLKTTVRNLKPFGGLGVRAYEIERLFYYPIFMKNTQYINIQGWMVNEFKLKGNDLIIYAIIYGFSQDEETEFRGSLNYLMKSTNTSKPTVIKSLKSLVNNKLIIKTKTLINNMHFNTYKVNLLLVLELYSGGKKSTFLDGKDSLPNNTINNTIEYRKEKFIEMLNPFKEKYKPEMLNDFYLYWTEKNKSGKKMRFEGQDYFDISRRLATWNKRNKKGGDEGGGTFDAADYQQ